NHAEHAEQNAHEEHAGHDEQKDDAPPVGAAEAAVVEEGALRPVEEAAPPAVAPAVEAAAAPAGPGRRLGAAVAGRAGDGQGRLAAVPLGVTVLGQEEVHPGAGQGQAGLRRDAQLAVDVAVLRAVKAAAALALADGVMLADVADHPRSPTGAGPCLCSVSWPGRRAGTGKSVGRPARTALAGP